MSGIPGSSCFVLGLYLLLTAAGCLGIGGIVPMILLLAGLGLAIGRSDLKYLLYAGAAIAWLYGVAAIVCLLVVASHVISLSDARFLSLTVVEHQAFIRLFGMIAFLSAFGWGMTKYALLPAFLPYQRRVSLYGFRGNHERDPAGNRNRLAAELAKWEELRAGGRGGEDGGTSDTAAATGRATGAAA